MFAYRRIIVNECNRRLVIHTMQKNWIPLSSTHSKFYVDITIILISHQVYPKFVWPNWKWKKQFRGRAFSKNTKLFVILCVYSYCHAWIFMFPHSFMITMYKKVSKWGNEIMVITKILSSSRKVQTMDNFQLYMI